MQLAAKFRTGIAVCLVGFTELTQNCWTQYSREYFTFSMIKCFYGLHSKARDAYHMSFWTVLWALASLSAEHPPTMFEHQLWSRKCSAEKWLEDLWCNTVPAHADPCVRWHWSKVQAWACLSSVGTWPEHSSQAFPLVCSPHPSSALSHSLAFSLPLSPPYHSLSVGVGFGHFPSVSHCPLLSTLPTYTNNFLFMYTLHTLSIFFMQL